MRLFELIEEQNSVWFASYGFSQLACVFVADVPRRGADEAGDGVFFLEFRHVEAHDGGGGGKQKRGELFAEFGFADARWAEEEE